MFDQKLSDFFKQDLVGTIVINTINAYSYVIAKKDKDFSRALRDSDVLLPDGFPITLASRLLCKKKIQKIAGEDIFFHLLRKMNHERGRVFFLGSSDDTLAKIEARINREFPNVSSGIFSPPYKERFSELDNQRMIDAVNNFKPTVLFVGMTAPKQEKWVYHNQNHINASIICSIGAVFDFYAGTVKRPSKFWINLRLEWFIRLLKEPKRLWKRYLFYSPKFLIDVFKAKLGI
ncbi:glycosyltransferase [Marinilabilia rubra]|uniref:Glycosyltransferase n=1 Tax=Marinilabilia rubra TaxID=2162893 RepID=A0A2U2B3Q5_9BACT|nr:glycosyltransferase [Marinilabilia rubra]